MDLAHYIAVRDERDALAERVRQLEAVLFDRAWVPHDWRLTTSEATILNVLALRSVATKPALLFALYGDDPDGGAEDKTLDVLIWKLRQKLGPLGIAIENVWGQGYRLDDTSRLFLTQMWKAAA